MTLQQCKDQIAQQYGYKEWNEAIIKAPSVSVRMVDAAAKLYASEKVKEALKLAADKAKSVSVGLYGNLGGHIIESTIINLESELLKQINKEI